MYPWPKYGITGLSGEKLAFTFFVVFVLAVLIGLSRGILLNEISLKGSQSDPIQPGAFCNQQGLPYLNHHPPEYKLNLVCGSAKPWK